VRRTSWWRRTRESRLNSGERSRQHVHLWARKSSQEGAEALPYERLGSREGALAGVREGEGHPTAVVLLDPALEQPGVGESGEQLGHGGTRDARPARQLCTRHPFASDRPEGEVLGHGQRWIVMCEQALDPAGRQRRHRRERLCGLGFLPPRW
jgi:hypothetical protein